MTRSLPVVALPRATGNGIVGRGDGWLSLDRDLRDSDGDRWYWHVRLTAADGPVEVRMARPGLVGGFGPAISRDGGAHYAWLVDRYAVMDRFIVDLRPGEDVLISATLPYGLSDLHRFVAEVGHGVERRTAGLSESGRPVPFLRLPAAGAPRSRLLLAARHHACEALGSLVLEGVVLGVLDLRRNGVAWARHTEVAAYPVVDVDGVESGDQGKARRPHDHNRDYGTVSRYAAVRAIRDARLFDDVPVAVLDLHTPGLIGPLEEQPFLVASGDTGDEEVVSSFAAGVRDGTEAAPQVLVFDEPWNSTSGEGARCFAAWARSHPTVRLATSVEYPNAVVRGMPVSRGTAVRFGRRLADALGRVLD